MRRDRGQTFSPHSNCYNLPVSQNSPVRLLSVPPGREFPHEWYELASIDNFWMQWRARAFFALLRSLGLPLSEPLSGLEIGCGNGTLRAQIERATAWTVDGADIDLKALEMNPPLRGETLLYDVSDRRQDMRERYDFLVLFDVIEHIADVPSFLNGCLFHLKPGGWLFVNVPALESLRSDYDDAVGHLRRYDRRALRRALEGSGQTTVAVRYWGATIVPLLAVRKLVLKMTPREKIVERGFAVPGRLADIFLKILMRVETRLPMAPPVGTSLMAAVRKVGPSR